MRLTVFLNLLRQQPSRLFPYREMERLGAAERKNKKSNFLRRSLATNKRFAFL